MHCKFFFTRSCKQSYVHVLLCLFISAGVSTWMWRWWTKKKLIFQFPSQGGPQSFYLSSHSVLSLVHLFFLGCSEFVVPSEYFILFTSVFRTLYCTVSQFQGKITILVNAHFWEGKKWKCGKIPTRMLRCWETVDWDTVHWRLHKEIR